MLIFAKAPVAGQVKTRLVPDYTPEQAALIHANLVHHILATAIEGQLCSVELWCTPSTDHPFFESCRKKYQVELKMQQGDNLGERMFNAFDNALKTHQHVILIGTDCPTLTKADLEESIIALTQQCEIAISPAADGGYVLIGLSRNDSRLFSDIDWGTDYVMQQTYERITHLNYRFSPLRPHCDLDYASDIHNLEKPLQDIALRGISDSMS